MQHTLFTTPPLDFCPQVRAAGCFLAWEDKILLIQRHPRSSQGNTWSIPAGKIEEGEDPRTAVVREIREEVGVCIDDETLQLINTAYCRLPHMDYIFYSFKKRFDELPKVTPSLNELIAFRWVTIDEALHLPLIAGGADALMAFKNS